MKDHLFAAILMIDLLAVVPMLCAVFPELYRAPIRALRQLRTALLFAPPFGFARDVTPHPISADSEAASGLRMLAGLGLSARVSAPATKTSARHCIAGDGSPCDAHQHVEITQTGFLLSPARAVVHVETTWDDEPTAPRGAT